MPAPPPTPANRACPAGRPAAVSMGPARTAFPQSGTGFQLGWAARCVARAALAGLAGLSTIASASDGAGKGAELYALHCAACHGERGRPVMPGTPDFTRPDALMRPDGVLMRAIREGRGAMPGYYGVLSDAELRHLVAHLRRLR